MEGKKISEINIGDIAEISKTITEDDVVLFGRISGDINPMHFDDKFARKTIFKNKIVHGMLTASYISAVIGMELPGPGTIYLSQELKFIAPVMINDTITTTIKVIEKIESKNKVVLETICRNQRNDIVIKGKAVVMPPN